MIMTSANKQAVITGASAGIGKAMAQLLAAQGYDLYIAARRLEKLKELAVELEEKHSVKVTPVQTDLTKKEDRDKLFQETGGEDHKIDLFFNNAGVGWVNAFLDQGLQELEMIVELNCMAVADLSHKFIPPMVKRGSGGMIVVASTAAFFPSAYFSAYAGSKAFDYYFAEGISRELSGTGVHVMSLCPGPTVTEFGGDDLDIQSMAGPLSMTAAAVAKAGYRGFRRKKRVVVPGFFNRLSVYLSRLFPRALVNWANALIFGRTYRQLKDK